MKRYWRVKTYNKCWTEDGAWVDLNIELFGFPIFTLRIAPSWDIPFILCFCGICFEWGY